MLLRFIIFQRFFILHFHVFSVTRCHHSYNELASFAFVVFVRHTTHCFLLLVCYMFCGWKHCPEEAHLNTWVKRWLIIKYNHQKSLFMCLFDASTCLFVCLSKYPHTIDQGSQTLKLKLLRGPNQDLWSNPRVALWRWHNSGGTWTLLETVLHLISCERYRGL